MRGSLGGLPLRAALKRGALITAANWPVVFIQFMMVSVHRLAMAVPVVGGIFVVAVLAGADVRALLAADLRAAIGRVATALAGRPEALATSLVAVGLVAVGGSAIVFLAQAGICHILTCGERQAGPLHRGPLRLGADDVGNRLVLRLQHAPEAETVARLESDFRDILAEGGFSVGSALPEEAEESALADFPRLTFVFNRRSFGRLRQLIDALNQLPVEADRR